MRTLIVAAGGGGDAITGAAIAGCQGMSGPPVVMTYSWDRLMVDPLPGPRIAADFTGLHQLAPHVLEVVATTTPIGGAGSSLPRLAAELPARLLLLDPSGGAVGMARQIAATVEFFQLDDIDIVDVGGDALTNGADPELRSPLADQLALAACVRTGLPTRLLIAGAGLDGELPAALIAERLALLDAQQLPPLDAAAVAPVRHVFGWHPSEASGLLAAAATGRRGKVEVRDAGDHIEMTDATTKVSAVDAKRAADVTPAVHLTDTASLDEAERTIREVTGVSEIAYEIKKAMRLAARQAHEPTTADLPAVDRIADDARAHGAEFISVRRLSELLGATTLPAFDALTDLLSTDRAARYEPSLYRTTSGRHLGR
ncbi:DUF1152 domain-containing protein [Pseudonocardia sp. KRD-184]|uniref:DUF1152 domain-containing protein n=1 Tax=Pseudonocardia oceani TaxID=2792013 RepID=A0ABS6U744_9PSEU|nr:DUF1152 domain-containing protein [Pseudonocardia oceani]MBW0090618.1 DUF1152 domain-containing protein [Pseudonocardia oceani]MBW0097738.1 DUF1152 domain-containing protein [Pseudonocardia oceani]MBW0110325.1 DUF1152 domain-containing protein [Pseudonocardia oceani]MBW0120847.1 DUF1152 domain-containing protein [Pseudonocardia oceani]MBW0128058.1 DUF1152 domain-containing protein [Pseudonocardia oceani]